MTIEQAKEIDMVNYLAHIGHHPVKIKEPGYWYKSPLRDEKSASFKVSHSLNRWFDFGDEKHGNLIDFGVLYHKCSVSDFLHKLDRAGYLISQRQWNVNNSLSKDNADNRIKIVSVQEISSYPLANYPQSRKNCKKLPTNMPGCALPKMYYALGLKNNSSGYELRNKYFKGSSSPKDITLIENGTKNLAVFGGFFNFLSYLNLYHEKEENLPNFSIPNSASFFDLSLPACWNMTGFIFSLTMTRPDKITVSKLLQSTKKNSRMSDISIKNIMT